MDFITWPELFLSIIAVISVFVGLSGVMLMVATELAEEGLWFRIGVLVPLGIAVAGFLLGGTAGVVLLSAAGLVAVGCPLKLAIDRRIDCWRAIATGLALVLVGGMGVASTVAAHFAYFVR